MKKITVDGVEYRAVEPTGNRAVVVVDRGWIFAGDVEDVDGRIRITRAVHVFRWTGGIGFAKMIESPDSEHVDLRPVSDVDMPADAELFRVPVSEDWGL